LFDLLFENTGSNRLDEVGVADKTRELLAAEDIGRDTGT
jgi:hypothetical protein